MNFIRCNAQALFRPRYFRIAAIYGLTLGASSALACDLCAVYSADSASGHNGGAYAGVSEQFSRYDQLREDGRKLPDSFDQRLNSSVTQLIAGYGFGELWNLQISAPYIVRDYRRPKQDITDSGSETGFGDVSLTAQYGAYQWRSELVTISWRLLAGIKLPTGDSGRFQEELGAEDKPAAGAPVSGIHGHDLVLGSGSVDAILGTTLSARSGRWLARGEMQYAARNKGDYDYRVGNDLQWNVGAGRYLRLRDGQTVAGLLNISGEYKKFDRVAGVVADDTQARQLSLGAQLLATLDDRWSADTRADFPVQSYGSSVQTASRYRLRLTLIRHF